MAPAPEHMTPAEHYREAERLVRTWGAQDPGKAETATGILLALTHAVLAAGIAGGAMILAAG